jgi:uncharacterized delta-60 repeat protein
MSALRQCVRAACLVALLIAGPRIAAARPGDLDASFGSGGIVISPAMSAGADVDVDPFGRIVVSGYMLSRPGGELRSSIAVSRWLPDGNPDASFGDGGIVLRRIGNGRYDSSETTRGGILPAADGGVLVASYASNGPNKEQFAVLRLRPDGSVDTSFGSGGAFRIPIGDFAFAADVIAWPPRRTVIVGSAYTSRVEMDPDDNGYQFALVALDERGGRVGTFGEDGTVRTGWGALSGFAEAAVTDASGRLVVAGFARDITLSGGWDRGMVLARYLDNGRLDRSFGGDGQVRLQAAGLHTGAKALAAQWDGKVVAAGWTEVDGEYDVALARFLADGKVDATFGDAGVVLAGFRSSGEAFPGDLLIQPDGKIAASLIRDDRLCVARYNPDGSKDAGFGDDGIACIETRAYARGIGIARQPDGKLLVSGATGITSTDFQLIVARFEGGPVESARCAADCDHDAAVTIAELIRAVGIAIGDRALEECAAADVDGDQHVAVNELVDAVGRALGAACTR